MISVVVCSLAVDMMLRLAERKLFSKKLGLALGSKDKDAVKNVLESLRSLCPGGLFEEVAPGTVEARPPEDLYPHIGDCIIGVVCSLHGAVHVHCTNSDCCTLCICAL